MRTEEMDAYAVIPLTRGKSAIIDVTSLPLVEGVSWYAGRGRHTWYASANERGTGRPLQMGRVILGLKVGDGLFADHRNGNGLDNLRSNLRIALKYQNHINSKKRRGGSSRYIGVSRERRPLSNKWVAQVTVNKRHFWVGRFRTAREAATARDITAFHYQGEFARLNFSRSNYENTVKPDLNYHHDFICRWCDKAFRARGRNQVYCGRRCHDKWWASRRFKRGGKFFLKSGERIKRRRRKPCA